MATGSGSLHNSRVVIHDTSTTDGGQSFAGVSHGTVNFGTINYDGSGKDSGKVYCILGSCPRVADSV